MFKQADISFAVTTEIGATSKSQVNFSTQDKNSAKLLFKFYEGNAPLNLVDVTPELTLIMEDGSKFLVTPTVTENFNGIMEYTLKPNEIRHYGKVSAELTLKYPNEKAIGGFEFNFMIRQALVDRNNAPLREFYVSDLETIKQEVRAKADSVNTDIAQFKTGVDAKTAEIQTNVTNLENNVNPRITAVETKVNGLETNVDQTTIIQVSEAKTDTANQQHASLDARIKSEVGRLQGGIDSTTAQLADTSQEVTRANKLGLKVNRGIMSHRGFQAKAPENTVKAIAEAGRAGYVLVEIDPRVTSDGIWILMHDDTVDRTTDGTGSVSAMTLAQIQALRIDSPAQLINEDEVIRVPLLEDALKEIAFWNMGVNLDGTKFTFNQANIEYLAGLLDKYNLTEKSWIACPTKANREMVKQYAPNVAVAWVSAPANVDADIAEAKNYKNAVIAMNSNSLTDVIIDKYNRAGIHSMAYTTPDIKTAYQWLSRGVSFVETDYVLPGSVY